MGGEVNEGGGMAFNSWKPSGTVEVMVFRPTMDEFKDFNAYIKTIERAGAHLSCGIAKVIPPSEWHPRPSRRDDYSDVDGLIIEKPVKERIYGQQGCYTKYNLFYRKSITVAEFRQMALSTKYSPPHREDLNELERYYWRSLLMHEPIYGADSPGSIYDDDIKEWNINRLGTILDLLNESKVEIKGVNTAYLYFGMWKTTFPWHIEDMDLYSINYLHFGAPKFWYGIPPESSDRFERLAAQLFFQSAAGCKAFLRHKMHLISPNLLKTHSIPYGSMVQHPGEFIITFPKGYHCGFNSGYNCAESTNFGSERWIDYGSQSVLCDCHDDSVRIDMIPFMRKYRAEQFQEWFDYWYGERLSNSTGFSIVNSSNSTRTVPSLSAEETFDAANEKASLRRKRRQKDSHRRGANKRRPLRRLSGNNRSGVKEDGLWREELTDLWSWTPANFSVEMAFNRRRSMEVPHCSVCQYFVPRSLTESIDRIPEMSERLIGDVCFTKDPQHARIDCQRRDLLLTCSICAVTVHSGCYALRPSTSSLPEESDEWRCLRCRGARTDLERRHTQCRLCSLRGGALVPVADGGFVHVICAIFDQRAIFVDPSIRDSVFFRPSTTTHSDSSNTVEPDSDQQQRNNSPSPIEQDFNCEYCGLESCSLAVCASCSPSEAVVLHPTCGRFAGVCCEFRDWPVLVAVVCPNHQQGPDSERNLIGVNVGEEVIVWMGEGERVVRGRVTGKRLEQFKTIDFLDGTVSNDVLPDDIVQCDCSSRGCAGNHVSGAKVDQMTWPYTVHTKVRVKWIDGLAYGGVFRRASDTQVYTIELADGESVEVFRDDLYALSDSLPDVVISRLANDQ